MTIERFECSAIRCTPFTEDNMDLRDGLVHRSQNDSLMLGTMLRIVVCKRRLLGPSSYEDTTEVVTCLECLATTS